MPSRNAITKCLEAFNSTVGSKQLPVGHFLHGVKLGDFTMTSSFVRVSCDEAGWLQTGRSRVRSPMVSFTFFINIPLPTAL